MRARAEGDEFRALRGPVKTGARVSVQNVPLGDAAKTLELERFDVWAPGAEIVVQNGDGSTARLEPPPVNYFRGTVAGDPQSLVFVSARSDGAIDGLIFTEDARYSLRSSSATDVMVDEAGPEEAGDGPPFTCDLDGAPAIRNAAGLPKIRSNAVAEEGTLSGTGSWTLNLAIETDFELYTDLGSSSGNVTTFIGNLVGAASVIYQRDLRTELLVSYSRIQNSASDPWTVDPGAGGTWNGSPTTYTTAHALAELGDVWANAGTRPFSGARSSVVLVSGKNQTAGVAWIGTTCSGDFTCSSGNCGDTLFNGHTGGRYAYLGLGNQSSTTVANPNNTVSGVQYGAPPTNYWSLLGFAHELGHNVDGPHTHCFALTPQEKSAYSVTRDYLDECFTGGGCFGGTRVGPPSAARS